MEFTDIIQLLSSTLRLSTPLLFACLAGLFSERAGIFDIGLEGKMLAAAFASAAVGAWAALPPIADPYPGQFSGLGLGWSAAALAVLAGILASMLLSLLHGFASITLRGNQLISGVAINFLASGVTVLVGVTLFNAGGQTPNLPDVARFKELALPLADTLRGVPILGPLYSEVISGQNLLVYVGFLTVPLTWWILFRTRFGLRLRAVGENPGAVDTAGVSVTFQRYSAVLICGILCGLAGSYLSMATAAAGFGREMSAGRGFIALAALIFAKWRPWQAFGACLLFGLLEAVGSKYQSLDIGLFTIPVQFMQALPYILTVVILAGFVGKAIPPRAGGVPYVKER
ncbi:ABC transporter permease [Algicella marina]|uniref:ABC transporter permease n=1 Tax=Algicella marina TaxID=2683284 RepID=A0A6P1T4P6_9RHOB|nr:ABC transporter permease [Algicella marina]QHQ36239.1 ABC transporter permease [Algicella marina]